MDRRLTSRRDFLTQAAGAFTGLGVASLFGCSGSPVSPAQTPSGSGSSTATVPNSSFVRVPANPSFAFTTTVTNAGAGESSPILNDYCVGIYLVTNDQYFAAGLPSHWPNGYPSGKGDHPVLWVSLVKAEAYCDWLTRQLSGWQVRLPPEAEWENAARGSNRSTYPWGNTQDTTYAGGTLNTKFNYNGVCTADYLARQSADLATYNDAASPFYGTKSPLGSILSLNSGGTVSGWIDHANYAGFVYTDIYDALVANGGFTTPVGNYPAGISAYGCQDMAGNAFEWTSSLITAQNGEEAGKVVNAVRGGSWYSTGSSCKTSYRGEGRASTGGYHSVGFRVVAVPK